MIDKRNLRRNLRGHFRTPAEKTTPAFNDYFKAKFFDLSYEGTFNECEAGVLTTELAARGQSYFSPKSEPFTTTTPASSKSFQNTHGQNSTGSG